MLIHTYSILIFFLFATSFLFIVVLTPTHYIILHTKPKKEKKSQKNEKTIASPKYR